MIMPRIASSRWSVTFLDNRHHKLMVFAAAISLLALASPARSTTYYLATAGAGGSDSNDGASLGTPWLTPNHPVNCGDLILATAGNYPAANFSYGDWGTVSCPGGSNVAWLKCAAFDACKITANGIYTTMAVTQSYWGVQGWEVTSTDDTDACFTAYPPSSSIEIHHIVFANDIANGCHNSGFTSGNNGNVGVDYLVVVGNIAYNASQSSAGCTSGISIYQPVQSDSLPGTHIYIAGNFSWGNVDANPCGGGAPSDGEGILIDTPDGSQGGLTTPYAGQIVVDNNILVANGGRGFDVFNNRAGSAHAAIYARHNTVWGNNSDRNETNNLCGEMTTSVALNVQEFFNIAATNAASGCGGYPLYAYYVANGDSSDLVYSNLGWATNSNYSAAAGSAGFSYGPNNLFGTNPVFQNATIPGAPNCAAASSVPNCMQPLIANFTPTAAAALSYGYQAPTTAQIYDPLFPQWLCNVNLPAGLITLGCVAQSAMPASVTITGVKAQ
jgi:hypothetical protein